MKITSVEPQKKNPHRFNIYLDGKFEFGADEDLVVDQRLVVGKEIYADQLEKLLWEAEVGKLMERIYGLFDRRMRTEKEVKEYLRNLSFKRKVKGQEEISDQAVELIINKLKQKRLINDTEFAQAWIESRGKKKGVQVLKNELYKKGVDRAIIEEVIDVEGLSFVQDQAAEKLLIKRLPRWKGLSVLDQKRKSTEFLMRRGFDYDLVKDTVEKVLGKEYNDL